MYESRTLIKAEPKKEEMNGQEIKEKPREKASW